MKQYPYLTAAEAADAAGRASAMAAAADRSGPAAAALCDQYGVQPSPVDPRAFEHQIWAAAGGAPADLPAPPDRRPAWPLAVVVVAVALLSLATSIIWQQQEDLAATRAATAQQTTEDAARRSAEVFVTSYMLGASSVSCQMEARVDEDLRRCLYWEGGDGNPVSSVPTATNAFPYRNGWAVLVNFRLSGNNDAERLLAGQAVYLTQAQGGAWVVERDRACCRVVNQDTITEALDEAQRTQYPPI